MKEKKSLHKAKPKRLAVATKISLKSDDLEYDKDFYKWANNQADFLKKGEFGKLDIQNLIEEIESLGRSEKRTLQSYLKVLLIHLLKEKYQKDKASRSWALSIKNSRLEAKQVLEENPSLKPKLNEIIKRAYESARLNAAQETGLPEKTFPKKCEWTPEEILF